MIITFKEMLWILVLKKWIIYEMAKKNWSTALKINLKFDYQTALTRYKVSDFLMNLLILSYEIKEFIPGNQGDR